MQSLFTTAQMQELDRIAIQERGIPSLELMEHAAQAVAETARELLFFNTQTIGTSDGAGSVPRVAAFCGPGNNGGDGIAAARLLIKMGYEVRAFLVGDRGKMTPDARAMEEKLIAAGGALETFLLEKQPLAWLSACGCMVDALFGVGLKRPVAGDFLTAVQTMNREDCPVVACDLPSGLDGDTGEVLGEAVNAAVTVTFTCAKPGLYLGEGGSHTGEVRVASIGIPGDLVRSIRDSGGELVEAVDKGRYRLPRRPRTAHKGNFGKIFILAGSEGYTGAPVLAARAAVRTGAGLVFLGVPRNIYPIVAVKCDEAMPFPLPKEFHEIVQKANGCDVALIGPGLGRSPQTERLVLALLAQLNIPVVLDADGINALSGHIDILDKRSAPTVLTPHEGEFQRLTGAELPIRDRLSAAREFARAHHCMLVLKGHGTVTASPDGRAWVNRTGNPGMAKGGSGDVLAGMIAALWGQKHLRNSDLAERAAAAVCYHGMAGDRCAQTLGEYAMAAGDLIEALPEILREQEQWEGQEKDSAVQIL
ncbi:MAG: NAD(P)H-hydrate dehydratase [Lawsonibacter sp.]